MPTASLHPTVAALMDMVARVIVEGIEIYPDLSGLEGHDDDFPKLPAYLAGRVEVLSHGQLTVRITNRVLFKSPVKGIVHYLVVCPARTPASVVTHLTNDMRLMYAGPYSDGFRLDAEQATPVAVASNYKFDIEHRIQQDMALKQTILDWFLDCIMRVRNEAVRQNNTDALDNLDRITRFVELGAESPPMFQLLLAAEMVGMSLADIM